MLIFKNVELGRVLCVDSRCEHDEVGFDEPVDILVVPKA